MSNSQIVSLLPYFSNHRHKILSFVNFHRLSSEKINTKPTSFYCSIYLHFKAYIKFCVGFSSCRNQHKSFGYVLYHNKSL